MKANDLLVRCLAWEEQGQWIAICIDYTLAAQGATAEEAKQKLHHQIRDYLVEAWTVDSAHVKDLLTRRAPLWDRVRWYFWFGVNNRPRLRRNAGKLVRFLKLAMSNRRPYFDPLPLMPTAA